MNEATYIWTVLSKPLKDFLNLFLRSVQSVKSIHDGTNDLPPAVMAMKRARLSPARES